VLTSEHHGAFPLPLANTFPGAGSALVAKSHYATLGAPVRVARVTEPLYAGYSSSNPATLPALLQRRQCGCSRSLHKPSCRWPMGSHSGLPCSPAKLSLLSTGIRCATGNGPHRVSVIQPRVTGITSVAHEQASSYSDGKQKAAGPTDENGGGLQGGW
jgi:hypothetical protein